MIGGSDSFWNKDIRPLDATLFHSLFLYLFLSKGFYYIIKYE